jgi:hypothetical protein
VSVRRLPVSVPVAVPVVLAVLAVLCLVHSRRALPAAAAALPDVLRVPRATL